MFTRQHLMLSALTLTSLVALSACESSTTGKQGLLEFRYSAEDDFANFNKPIAVGAKLDLRVYKAGNEANSDATVEDATSEDDAILKVASTSGNTIVLEATGDGSAEITVTAKLAATGESVTDAVDLMARVPEVIKVNHLCLAPGEVEGYYLKNQKVYLPFEMQLKDGQDVIGYGYYPVKFDNEAVKLTTTNKLQSFIEAELGEVEGAVKVSSDLDTTLALTLNIVEPGQIDGAKLDSGQSAGVGQTTIRNILPTIGGKPICQATTQFTVETLTTDICEVTKLTDESTQLELTRKLGWIDIKGKAVGDCKFTVNYPQGAAGAGVSAELEIAVENK